MDSFYKKNTEHKWKEAKIHLSRPRNETILPIDNLCNLIISAGVKMLQSANLENVQCPCVPSEKLQHSRANDFMRKKNNLPLQFSLNTPFMFIRKDSPLAVERSNVIPPLFTLLTTLCCLSQVLKIQLSIPVKNMYISFMHYNTQLLPITCSKSIFQSRVSYVTAVLFCCGNSNEKRRNKDN